MNVRLNMTPSPKNNLDAIKVPIRVNQLGQHYKKPSRKQVKMDCVSIKR